VNYKRHGESCGNIVFSNKQGIACAFWGQYRMSEFTFLYPIISLNSRFYIFIYLCVLFFPRDTADVFAHSNKIPMITDYIIALNAPQEKKLKHQHIIILDTLPLNSIQFDVL